MTKPKTYPPNAGPKHPRRRPFNPLGWLTPKQKKALSRFGQMNTFDKELSALELAAYRKGLVDGAEICRAKASQLRGEGWLSLDHIEKHDAHMEDAEALIELAQGLAELPKP